MARTKLTDGNNGKKKIDKRQNNNGQSLYKPEYDDQAFSICSKLGAKEVDLAEIFGVAVLTIRDWRRRYKTFHDAVVTGRDIYDNEVVETTLLHRAIGFEYDEVTTEEIVLTRKNGKETVRLPAKKTKTTKRYLPGEISAIFFWLQNRNPDRWKNVKYMQLSGKTETLIKGDGYLSKEQLAKLDRVELEKLAEILAKTEYEESATASSGSNNPGGEVPRTFH